MAAFFFASPVDIDIRLEGEEGRKQVELKLEKERKESCPVYYDGDSIIGQASFTLSAYSIVTDFALQATVRVRDGKKLTHDGIKVEFVGSIGAEIVVL